MTLLLVASLIAASLIARVALLISRPLWHDELFTIWAARLSLPRLLEALRHDSGPPLFYLLEKPFVLLAETLGDDRLPRLLSLVAVLSLFAASGALPPGKARVWFVALCACSPLLLVYSAEARAYALLALLNLGLFLVLFCGKPAPGRFLGGAVLAALALWTHYLAIFFVAACAATALLRRRAWGAAACGAGFLMFSPWLPSLLAQPPEATSWMREPIGSTVLAIAQGLGAAPRLPLPLGPTLPSILSIGGLLAALLFALAAGRSASDEEEIRAGLQVVSLCLASAIGTSLLQPIAFAGRTEMAVAPLVLWIAARAVTMGRLGVVAATALLGVGTASSAAVLVSPRAAAPPAVEAPAVLRSLAPNDAIYAAGAFYLPLRLAADRGELSASVKAIPSELEQHPGWFRAAPLTAQDRLDLLQRLRRHPSPRVFLLLPPELVSPELVGSLAREGKLDVIARTAQIALLQWRPAAARN